MREVRPEANVHGAGVYREPRPSPARCKRGANPFGHNPECDCRDERPSQVVPYMESAYEYDE